MKFSIPRTTFLKAIQRVNGAIERRHTLPILQNVLLDAHNGTLTATGTDLEIELVCRTSDLNIATEGRITVPAKKLFDIVRALPDDEPLVFSVKNDSVTLTQGKRKFTLQSLPAGDFPNTENNKEKSAVTLPCSTLLSLINSTSFSMANQDVRYYLNGMLFEFTGDHLMCVATDGHRLAISKSTIEASERESRQVILPRKSVLELCKLLGGNEGDSHCSLSDNHICFTIDDMVITTKLIDGRFPDYRRVLPRNQASKVRVSREDLKGACVRASILANEKYRGVSFTFEGAEIRLLANNPEHEEAEEIVDAECELAVKSLAIGFNVNYVLDVLNAIQDETIVIELGTGESSALCYGLTQQNSRYVLMPMRL